MQISFLPKIDRKATQKRVEDALETARIYKQIGFVRREMKNTPSYAPRFHGQTNETGAPVQDVALWNVDKEAEIKELCERIDRAVNRLSKREAEIIQLRYLEDESFDYIVAGEVGLSERTYTRVKARAFYKLAFMLKLEVLSEDPDPVPA